ncbi:hypothetical protein [Microlunatus flavus]|uniref:Beta-galactosidase trimerisation domain-containing protein n=1 Tax=Microlunatus flavus TaxID=1036181 RepID=A0A1H9JHG0_9ACTN|nr:hypothetical protein [Microlunatus flavus]SEQ86286.1 hypothetical protein SAMN05421756_106211 [Microlunatus flavus]
MERGVYFDAWYPGQHCYHPSLPPRRLRMVEDLVDYRATVLVWAAMGGGSLALPYLEQEAFGDPGARARFYGTVNDAEFVAACQARGIKVFGIVFEAQGWEFGVELDDDETTVLALNELRGVGHRDWMGLREFSSNRYPNLWAPFEDYFPGGLTNSRGERVTDLIEECVARDIDQKPCHARWVECPDRDHQCFYMDRNNPVWREYLKAVIRIQVDAGVDGVQLDEAELPLGAMQYGACFCKDCMAQFRAFLQGLDETPAELDGVDLTTFHYGDWLRAQGFDFRDRQRESPLFDAYYAYQCAAITTHFAELARYAKEYARSRGREVLVSGNFFNLDPHYLPLADEVDLIITEMRNTTYRQPEWYRYVDAFRRYAGVGDVVVVENPYGGVVPELIDALAAGRGRDRLRLSLYEAAAFGANMSVPYGSWMGATIQDSFWAPHDLLVEIQDFVAETEPLRANESANEVGVVYSVVSMRDLVNEADSGDNLVNARDETVQVPFRQVTEALSHGSVPFDVVIMTDGGLAGDRTGVEELGRYCTLVLPGCWWLTDHQVAVLLGHLDAGGRVVATGEVGTNADSPDRDRLRSHPGLVTASAAAVLDELVEGPQVTCSAPLAVNLHRLADGRIAAHLVSYDHDDEADQVRTLSDVRLDVRVPGARSALREAQGTGAAELVVPGAPPASLALTEADGRLSLVLPEVGPYAVVVLPGPGTGR